MPEEQQKQEFPMRKKYNMVVSVTSSSLL